MRGESLVSREAGAAVPAEAPGTVEHGWRLGLVATGVILATLLEMVDTTIVNVALPDIQGNLGATIDEGTYIVTGYIVSNVVVVPLTPWLQARFGLKRYYLASIATFLLASVMCGLSANFTALVLWRIVQGVGGGGLISSSQTILREIFPPTMQGAAQGIFAGGVIIGPTLGPLIGGYITDNLDWRWCFFVNVPVGIAALTILVTQMREGASRAATRLDVVGLVLLAVGLGSLQFVLDQGERSDWFGDSTIASFALVALCGLASFVVRELRTALPVVDLRILRHRSVWAGSALGGTLGLALFGSLVTLPQYVQGSLGFTALLSGELLSIRAIAMAVFLPIGARLATSGRIDTRLQIGFGLSLVAIASFMQANVTTSGAPFTAFAPALIVSGIGLSQVFVPLQLAVFQGLDDIDVPKAASFFNLARQLGGSIATAVLITLLDRSIASHRVPLAAAVTRSAPAVGTFLATRGNATSAIAQLEGIVSVQATVLGYADVARVSGAITLILTPLVLVLPRSSRTAGAVAMEA